VNFLNSAVSSDFFLIAKEILVCIKDKYSISVERTFFFCIWRCKFDTDLVRSSPVYEMYYFEMPSEADDVDYYSSFL